MTDESSTCWQDGERASVSVADVIADDESRDSGICLMDTTSGADDAYQHDFSVISLLLVALSCAVNNAAIT